MDSVEEEDTEEEDSGDEDSMDEDEVGNWQKEMKSMSKIEQLKEILNKLREFKRQG